MPEPGPPLFNASVPDGGYRWWYLDALDPSGCFGLVIIAFIGSVFSPYYRRARARGLASAEQYCALNVGIYGERGKRWCMTERRAHHVDRTPDSLNIGPSHIRWHSGALQFDIQERSAPFGRALRGRVRVEPLIFSDRVQRLDPYGKHLWYPWAPLASIEVNMESPGLNWKGHAYLDGNAGEEPLEAAFTRWDWSRSHSGHGAQIDYDVSRVDGTRSTLSMHIGPDGRCTEQGHPPRQSLRRSGWGIPREAASLHPLKLLRTLEDTPFYARTLLSASTPTGPCLMMHESLSLKRFRRCWVRALLPFRMPRELKGYQST